MSGAVQAGDLLAQTDASMIDWWFKEAYRWLFDASDTSRKLAIAWLVFLALILCVSSCYAPMACFASDEALGVSMLLGLLCTVGFLGAIIPWAVVTTNDPPSNVSSHRST